MELLLQVNKRLLFAAIVFVLRSVANDRSITRKTKGDVGEALN